jgi:pimeloyl-ACP methyl ester carboxylesterase
MRSAFGCGLTAILLIALGLFLARPVERIDDLRKVRLSLYGVRRVRAGTLAAYEEDLCETGKPCRCVALIHGLGDSALTWDNVLLGKKGAPAPPRGTKLLAVELPGSEGSDPPSDPAGYAVPAMAKTIEDSLRARCPSWTLVGNSLGGFLAADIALDWPGGVEKLYLVNAAGLDDPSGVQVETARILQEPTGEKMREFSTRAYYKKMRAPLRVFDEVAATIRTRPAAKIVAQLKKEDLLDSRAKLIRAPTTILWGEADRVVPRTVGEGFAKKIPGAKLVLIPKCGHLPQQECPEAVSKALFGD